MPAPFPPPPDRLPIAVRVEDALADRPPDSERRTEIIALAPSPEEFTHLDAHGQLVHRVWPARSYLWQAFQRLRPELAGSAPPDWLFAVRAAEKCLELSWIWNRTLTQVELRSQQPFTGTLPLLPYLLARGVPPAPAPIARFERSPPSSVDLVICSYGRFEELVRSIESALAALEGSPIAGQLLVVFQDHGFPARLQAARPDLAGDPLLVLLPSTPPSLTRARNLAIRESRASLLVFVDDDVLIDPGFLTGYLAAAERHPAAIGFVGRVRSPSEPEVKASPAVGQIRPTGAIDINFNSLDHGLTIVPHTPMGTNMAFRRTRMNTRFGEAWFDERLRGSAIREESTLSLKVNRAGEYFVFVPEASLQHLEARAGGCNNRGRRTFRQQVNHAELEMRFLNALYERAPLLRAPAALRLALRAVLAATGNPRRVGAAAVQLLGYLASQG